MVRIGEPYQRVEDEGEVPISDYEAEDNFFTGILGRGKLHYWCLYSDIRSKIRKIGIGNDCLDDISHCCLGFGLI